MPPVHGPPTKQHWHSDGGCAYSARPSDPGLPSGLTRATPQVAAPLLGSRQPVSSAFLRSHCSRAC